jgi:glyceraldehyde 3-phosphate dehydrogenase
MKKIRVAFNGFGRIGRLAYRASLQHKDIEVVAINNRSSPEQTALQLRYDSVHGSFPGTVEHDNEHLVINEHKIRKLQISNIEELPWKEFAIDVVIECTGVFLTKELASKHIAAGAKRVLLSAPAKGDEPVKTVVLGVNEHEITADDLIISNASCTTNCFAPIAKVLNDNFGIDKGYMVTIHAYTADQQLVDGKHKDARRARAAALNVIPTSSGAAKAVGEVIPELQGKLHAEAVRVPIPCGSMIYLTADLGRETSKEEVNALFKDVATHHLKNVLEYSEEPLVSSDIVGNPHSSILDSSLTDVDGEMVKLVSWYDNEWGYSNRVIDVLRLL